MKKFTISFLILFASLLSAQVMQNEEPGALVPTESKFLSDQIIVQGLYIRTLGNFNKVWSSGTGVYVNYGMFFPDHNTLNFQVGYLDYKLQDDESEIRKNRLQFIESILNRKPKCLEEM